MNAKPFPGDGYVNELVGVDNSTVAVSLADVDWPCQVTTEEIPAGEWAYDTNGDIRPILNYAEDNEQFISEQIPASVPIQYQVYLREHLPSEDPREGESSGGPRRHAGTTQEVVRHPGEDEYTIAPGATAHEDIHQYNVDSNDKYWRSPHRALLFGSLLFQPSIAGTT